VLVKLLKVAGGLLPYNQSAIKFVNNLSNGVYEFEAENVPKKGRRSTLQNAYYFAILDCIVREVDNSYDKDFFHNSFKNAYFGIQSFNGLSSNTGSTTQMSTGEFSNYIDMIREWAWNKLELDLPKADEFGLNR
jgi:hypothetical protein